MKRLLLSLYLLLSCSGFLYAQKRLAESPVSGHYTYVYKLNDTEALNLALKTDQRFSEKLLHTLVDSFSVDQKVYPKKLPYGNYIDVSVSGNRLNYQVREVQNVQIKFIDDGNAFQFIIIDMAGRLLENAEVRQGTHQTIRFEPVSRSYHGKAKSKDRLITIRHEGISNYFRYRYDKPEPYRKNNGPEPDQKLEQYIGQLHFNKPKYRPLDTVRFKVYLVTRKGKALQNKTLKLELNNSGRDLYISTLKPYREGGYEGSFVLTDTMKLKLDNSYHLQFKEYVKGKWETVYSGFFQYQDYELNSASFFVRSDKTVHHPGNPVTFYLKATDENGLTIPDGRVEVQLKSGGINKFYQNKEFVKTDLWKTDIRLDPSGETKLLLPDSIFPKVNMDLTATFKFRNSNNEAREAIRYFRYEYEEKELIASLEKDSLRFEFKVNDSTVSQHGMLYIKTTGPGYIDSLDVRLPFKMKINPQATEYAIRTPDSGWYSSNYYELQPQFDLSATQRNDSLSVQAGSAQQIPFWYTLFAGDQVLKRGYTLKLDTVLRNKTGKTAEISLSYLWKGYVSRTQKYTFSASQTLDVKLEAPSAIYPGETVQMNVRVTDTEKRPVANTDLTAYGYTAKFGDEAYYLDFFEKPYKPRPQKQMPYSPFPAEKTGSLKLDWSKWHQKFGLDTIPYFQFIYPNELYLGKEKIKSNETVVLPFVITEGAIEPAVLVYIDDLPVYYNGASQLKRYAFNIQPGVHKIEVLTAWSKIRFNHNFEQGFKTILGIDSDPSNTKAQVSPLGEEELGKRLQDLRKYMIYINENFEGNKTTIHTGSQELLINPPPNAIPRRILYIGPIQERQLRFRSGDLDVSFNRDSSKIYTFLKDKTLERKIDSADSYVPFMTPGTEARSFQQDPLAKNAIDSIWNDYLDMRSRNSYFEKQNSKSGSLNTGNLRVAIDTAITNHMPYVKNTVIYKKDDSSFLQAFGGYPYEFRLDEGHYQILILFKDNRYIIENAIPIQGGGTNYFMLKDKQIHSADEMSKALDHKLKFSGILSPGNHDYKYKLPARLITAPVNQTALGTTLISGTITDEETGETLPGAGIYYSSGHGPLKAAGLSNGNGYFSFFLPKKGFLTITYVGYQSKRIAIKKSSNLQITLSESKNAMNEVVIRGYNGRRRRGEAVADVPVSNVEQLLQGKVAGLNIQNDTGAPGLRGSVNIRGLSTITTTGSGSDVQKNTLLIVDGKPFSGTLGQIDQTAIISVEVLSDARAIAIYGALGANGVILVKTNGSQYFGADGGRNQDGQQQSLRSNFSDYAFWQPKLLTDQDGKASFKVKFPDDITNWNTMVYAMNGNRQYGYLKSFTRSFKTLSASITSPLFALSGDSLNLIGKLMNYSDKDESVSRKFEYNGKETMNNKLTFKNSYIDTIGILAVPSASNKDSLQFLYTLRQEKGYFDGERRKIPLLPLGTQESKGYFIAMTGDTSITYNFDNALGPVMLHAEASIFSVLLSEMDKLRNYEYLCNEQLASKLKGLLLEQKLRKYLKEDFKGEKNIKELIKKLQNNRGPRGGWGWWADSNDEMWISGHVVEALLLAREAGYTVELDTRVLYNYLNDQLSGRQTLDQLFMIKLMRIVENKYNFRSWIEAIEKQKASQKDQTLFSHLQLMQLKQQAGMPVDINWLLKQKKSTMFGNSYWGEQSFAFWDNSIQNTLLAYHILKSKGGYNSELNLIIRYFLEQRKDGQWRNTYESSLILETIMPELMTDGKKPEPPSITLNKTEIVTTFPFSKTLSPQKITVDKKGNAPVYFTAYQQFQNSNPEKVGKDFTVKSAFLQNNNEVKSLKGGTTAILKVEVEVRADADYVMIEIPIPAGCSYENKPQSYWGVEAHREYFKHKTTIFCTKLKQGKYTFTVQLMPRYSGVYNLNPAKAEMMYFPVFFGREGTKKVNIN
jgi:TonB-dependent SusC/RagA subfamily outer membrane receptor